MEWRTSFRRRERPKFSKECDIVRHSYVSVAWNGSLLWAVSWWLGMASQEASVAGWFVRTHRTAAYDGRDPSRELAMGGCQEMGAL